MPSSIAIIAPSSVPFQVGGAEKFWWGLREGLARYSECLVELIKIPAPEANFEQIVSSYRAFSQLDLSHFDMVISSKYPAWMVNHHNHVLYMQHPLRGLYDTYHFTGLPEKLNDVPRPLRELLALIRKPRPNRAYLAQALELCEKARHVKSLPWNIFSFPGPLIRELVHFFDNVAKGGIRSFLAISATVRNRQDYFPPQADVLVLPHPSDICEYLEGPGEYIFTASRLNSMKRLHLLIKAMRHVKADIPFKIAGTGPEFEHLQALAANDSRIEFLGHVPDADLPRLYANAFFVPFVPYDEDYGLITIEAMSSGKAVLTAKDSGGVADLVKDGLTGFCVDPDPVALGLAMEKMLDNPEKTAQMGRTARADVAEINWQNTAEILLASANGALRPRIVVCSHFPPRKDGAGGERRLYHLCRELAHKYDVCMICMGNQTQKNVERIGHEACFRELRLPWPETSLKEAGKLREKHAQSVDDIAIMRHCADNGLLREILAKETRNAGCLIVSHCYIFPVMDQLPENLAVIYDAHNVEADLKKAVFADSAPEIVRDTAEIERQCCKRANFILACSKDDSKRFHELYNVPEDNSRLVPNGFDSERLAFASREQRRKLRQSLEYPEARLALFIGSGHAPNIEAAGAIMRIAHQMPDVEFLIAGSVSTQAATRGLDRPGNVHLLGIVPENVKDALLRAADVAINPVTTGSGTNLKIVEYLATGLPCVSTPFGARGLEPDLVCALHVGALEDFPVLIEKALAEGGSKLTEKAARLAQRLAWPCVFKSTLDLVDAICGTGDETPD